jgi:hypothetical protein
MPESEAAEPVSGYQWRIRVDGHPNSGCWIDVMDGDFQNLNVVGRLEFRAKPCPAVEPDDDDSEPQEFTSATCRPVTLESGETVPVLGDEPLSARGVAALAELIEAARAKHAAENPPDEGAPELFERIEAARGDRSLRECARLAGVRFAVLFRIRQGRMPGAQDPAAIEAWLAAQDETTNTQEGTS